MGVWVYLPSGALFTYLVHNQQGFKISSHVCYQKNPSSSILLHCENHVSLCITIEPIEVTCSRNPLYERNYIGLEPLFDNQHCLSRKAWLRVWFLEIISLNSSVIDHENRYLVCLGCRLLEENNGLLLWQTVGRRLDVV